MKLSCCYEARQRVKEIRFNLPVCDLRAKSILRPKFEKKNKHSTVETAPRLNEENSNNRPRR